MGCFSWMFANKNNRKALRIGETGYLVCPDGTVYGTEGGYDGYGKFGPNDAYDAYAAVADWNREALAKQPDFIVPQHGRIWDQEEQEWYELPDKRLSEYSWWPFYSDLTLTPEQITAKMREMATRHCVWEYRWIGIDIACYDDQNEKIPFPIKISSRADVRYDQLPPSKGDPNQGFR